MAGRSTDSSSASFSRSRSSWRCTSSSVTARPGKRDLQPVVAGDGDERAHLHDGVEGDGARCPRRAVMSISGCAMGSSSVSTTARA